MIIRLYAARLAVEPMGVLRRMGVVAKMVRYYRRGVVVTHRSPKPKTRVRFLPPVPKANLDGSCWSRFSLRGVRDDKDASSETISAISGWEIRAAEIAVKVALGSPTRQGLRNSGYAERAGCQFEQVRVSVYHDARRLRVAISAVSDLDHGYA